MTTDKKSIADKLRERGFTQIPEDQRQENISHFVATVCSCEDEPMTTDLKSMTVEECVSFLQQLASEEKTFADNTPTGVLANVEKTMRYKRASKYETWADSIKELARRLEEAQQKIAEAKAEALEEAANWFLYNWFGPIDDDWYDLNKPTKILEQLAAEYRAKAKGE